MRAKTSSTGVVPLVIALGLSLALGLAKCQGNQPSFRVMECDCTFAKYIALSDSCVFCANRERKA